MDAWLANLFLSRRPLALAALQWPPTLRLVVLAPHPDDFDAIGATMRFFQENGNRLDVAVATSSPSGVEDGFNGSFAPERKAALRENEQRASCQFFGLAGNRLEFLNLTEDQDGHPEDSEANLHRIRAYLAARRPDLVFLPHGNDANQGHRRIYEFFRQSVQKERLSLVACLNRDPKTIAMRNDLYLDFGPETAAWKGALLRIHESQQQRNLNKRGLGFDERILRVNRETAALLGLHGKYAEAFELELFRAANDGA
jgi:LmbE family N-acetylglucosaminyl deacetylase